jgi:putative glutamine amidotransferase
VRPVIGIIGNHHLINDQYSTHAGGTMNSEAVAEVSGCMPLLIPSDPRFVSTENCWRPVRRVPVHRRAAQRAPEEYGEDATEAHGAFDRARDAVVLPLIRACVERGLPFPRRLPGVPGGERRAGRVALPRDPGPAGADEPPDAARWHDRGEIRAPPCRDLHRGRAVSPAVRRDGGDDQHAARAGDQAAGQRIVIDGHAPDGTPEAVYVEGAPGFTLSVQWHPEYRAAQDPVSRPLFRAFGDAARAWSAGKRPVSVAEVA